MAIKVTCPACQDTVSADESDRGSLVKCGTCWSEVKIPAGEDKPKVAVAKAIPVSPGGTAGVPMAVAKPLTGTTPTAATAKPVVAAPVAAAPVAKAAAVAPEAAPNSRRKKATDDDADDDKPTSRKPRRSQRDDEDEMPAKKGGATGLIIGLLVLLMLGGLGGVVGAIWYFTKPKSDTAESTQPDDAGAPRNTGFTPTNPNKPATWDAVQDGDGFTAEIPTSGRIKAPTVTHWNARLVNGTWHRGMDFATSASADIKHFDLEDAKGVDLWAFSKYVYALNVPATQSSTPKTVGGRPGMEYVATNGATESYYLWATQVGSRVYTFLFTSPFVLKPEAMKQKDYFFNSIRITAAGSTTPGTIDPLPPVKSFDDNWKPIANTIGITVRGPVSGSSQRHQVDVNNKLYRGEFLNYSDAGYDYHIYAHDHPTDQVPDRAMLLQRILNGTRIETGPEETKLDGKPAQSWTLRGFANTPSQVRTVTLGFRTFTILVGKNFGNRDADSELDRRAKAFYSGIKFPFDPNDPTYDPLKDSGWTTWPKTSGFTLTGPKGVRTEDNAQIGFGFGDNVLQGFRYTAEDEFAQVQVMNFPITPKWNALRIINGIVNRDKLIDGPSDVKVGGASGERRVLEDFFRNPIELRTAQVGDRLIALRVAKKGRPPEKDYADRLAKVLASFKIEGGSGTTQPTPTPTPTPTPIKGQLVFAGTVVPHWAALMLPTKNELLLFSTRPGAGQNRAGVLRRYSYPEFKLKATYHLPQAVTRAVADEKAGKLYCAAVIKDQPLANERELAYLPSVVQVYDLKKILDGSLNELEDLKTITVFPVAGNLSGLEIAPDGTSLYVSTQIPPPAGNTRIGFKGKLYRFDLDKQKANGELDHPEPISCLRVSPSGKQLVAGEISLTPFGTVAPGGGKQLHVLLVDANAWKKSKNWPVAGPVADLTFADDEVMALIAEPGQPKLYQIQNDGTTRNLAPNTNNRPVLYVRASADGNRALASTGFGLDGAFLYEILQDQSKLTIKPLASGEMQDAKKIGGHFILTPDNKYAIMQCGAIIDIVKSSGR